MKALSNAILVLVFFSSVIFSAHSEEEDDFPWGPYEFHDNISIDFEDGTLLAFDSETDALLFEITGEFQLYVDGELVKTNEQQEDLLYSYYTHAEEIMEKARKIAYKGAQIGMEGAKIALQAAGGVFEMLFSGFDDSVVEDFEKEMESESEDLEEAAEHLEEEAEVIEDLADEMDDLFDELQQEIPELRDLNID